MDGTATHIATVVSQLIGLAARPSEHWLTLAARTTPRTTPGAMADNQFVGYYDT
jgi:hypothetical protein